MHGDRLGPSGALPSGDLTITKGRQARLRGDALAAAKQVTGATFDVVP